jgi:hypothetical protein
MSEWKEKPNITLLTIIESLEHTIAAKIRLFTEANPCCWYGI